jgi:hypothetical protein
VQGTIGSHKIKARQICVGNDWISQKHKHADEEKQTEGSQVWNRREKNAGEEEPVAAWLPSTRRWILRSSIPSACLRTAHLQLPFMSQPHHRCRELLPTGLPRRPSTGVGRRFGRSARDWIPEKEREGERLGELHAGWGAWQATAATAAADESASEIERAGRRGGEVAAERERDVRGEEG